MKRFLSIAIVILMATLSANAQETLITTNGEIMTVYDVEVSSSAIFYKTENSQQAQIQRIDKSNVYMIKRADGTNVDLGNSQATKSTSTQSQASVPAPSAEMSDEAKQRNKELIDAANYAAALPEHKELSDKRASWVYASLGVAENSVMCNDDIELSIENNGCIVLIISNKSNHTIFIDQANTFFISSGESSPYYVPMAYSSSTSKTGDANAGSFAGAMGIHDYQTNISTSTVYSQRVVSIPPNSQKRLESKWLFPTRSHLCCPGVYFAWIKYGKQYYGQIYTRFAEGKKSPDVLKVGETLNYSSGNSPLKFTFYVTYSFKEDCEATNSVSLNLFMKKAIGFSPSGSIAGTLTGIQLPSNSLDRVIPEYNSAHFYFIGTQTLDDSSAYYNFEGTVFKRP